MVRICFGSQFFRTVTYVCCYPMASRDRSTPSTHPRIPQVNKQSLPGRKKVKRLSDPVGEFCTHKKKDVFSNVFTIDRKQIFDSPKSFTTPPSTCSYCHQCSANCCRRKWLRHVSGKGRSVFNVRIATSNE